MRVGWRQGDCRVSAANDVALWVERAFDGASKDERFNLVIKFHPGHLSERVNPGRDLAEDDECGLGLSDGTMRLDQLL